MKARMRGAGSGAAVEAQTTNVWTMRDGLAVRIAVYNDRDEAFRVAGAPDGDARATVEE